MVSIERTGLHSIDYLSRNAAVEALLIQKEPIPPYGAYDHAAMTEKLAILCASLANKNGDTTGEAAITQAFIDRCFEDFNNPSLDYPHGSFGFIVPPRTRREVLGESDDYMAEWSGVCPILKHFDSRIVQRFVVGLPPWIVDTYGADAEGKRGYMLCAPMLGDMWNDLKDDPDPTRLYHTGKSIMNDTLDLAHRLKISTVGFGATLPRFLFFMNKIGDQLDDHDMDITTGHSGTVWLMGETLIKLTQERRKGLNGSIGILGAAGSIGIAFIGHLRENLGYKGTITVYDSRPEELKKVLKLGYDNIVAVSNEKELIQSSGTIVCAATTTLSFDELGIKKEDVDGKYFIDDSQPGCVKPKEVRDRDGRVVWVIGQDPTETGELTRTHFSYNGFGPIKRNEIWGCELEVFLARMYALENRLGSLAVRQQITPQNVRQLADYAKKLNVKVAALQAQGEYLAVA